MPFQKHARITVENTGKLKLDALYYNIDYQAHAKPLPVDTLYFHAQYRQASPTKGISGDWKDNNTRFRTTRKTWQVRATTFGLRPRDAATTSA
jgi:hypothetical protein